MASFGAKYPRFSPIQEEPAGALPTYKGPVTTIGKLIKADMTITTASGKLYAEDALSESVDEFVSASIAMETDDMLDEAAAVIYGVQVVEKEVHYNSGDTPPMGGLAYYKVLMRNGEKFYKGYFYPRTKATLGNDTAQTKSDSITFGTNATTFTAYECSTGDWRLTETFKTEAEVRAWVDEKLAAASTPPQGG